ncbi:DUF6873 family GME fold protein [Alkalibaculum bacchi]|uniref:DUF6873 family GME fold protein n=1 Tax=Alkalibaculum bacchi TaxID=645887 RepID=UPI0026F00E4D|nr:hypothetical protein [Alkalibaculum bacchi]
MKCIISEDISQESYYSLLQFSKDFMFIRKYENLHRGIDSHADLQCFPLEDNVVVVHPEIHPKTIGEAKTIGINLLYGKTKLEKKYPKDIPYNVAKIGENVLHSVEHMDPIVKMELEFRKYNFINVKQGYTKCSVLPLGDHNIITADQGIAKTIRQSSIDVLLIEGGHIELPGFNTGFIGGACGVIQEKGIVLFNGDIALHPNYIKIHSLLKETGYDYKCLNHGPLTDVGSIFFLP